MKHKIAAMIREAGRRWLPPPPAQIAPPAMSVPEITPSGARTVAQESPRLNFLLPSINPEHYFGGIHTAVQFYRALCGHFPESRIVLTDSAPREAALAVFPDHVLVDSQQESTASRQIVPFNDRYQRPLAIGRGDVFAATAWWTAFAAQSLTRFQAETYGTADHIAYLIQDFEPGFYPWSSRYALAMSTYRANQDYAVFNTRQLADYASSQGLRYGRASVFEPVLNAGLQPFLKQARGACEAPRRRRILVYARPSTPRNAFELICEALTHWSVTFPGALQWEVLALGELEGPIQVGATTMHGVGKLCIAKYGELLADSAVGLSLMVSPHPSYPPLEMGAFGLRTVVNAFGNKDLSLLGDAFNSVDCPSPEKISAALAAACMASEASDLRPVPVGLSGPPGYFDRHEDQLFPGIAIEVAAFLG